MPERQGSLGAFPRDSGPGGHHFVLVNSTQLDQHWWAPFLILSIYCASTITSTYVILQCFWGNIAQCFSVNSLHPTNLEPFPGGLPPHVSSRYYSSSQAPCPGVPAQQTKILTTGVASCAGGCLPAWPDCCNWALQSAPAASPTHISKSIWIGTNHNRRCTQPTQASVLGHLGQVTRAC